MGKMSRLACNATPGMLGRAVVFSLVVGILTGCAQSPPSLLDMVATGDVAKVVEALDAGADPNTEFVPVRDELGGASPLHLAAFIELPAIIEALIENGADVDLRASNVDGASPLGWAIFFGKYRSAEVLLNNGADFMLMDNHGNNAMEINAVGWTTTDMKGRLKELLMDHGAQ